MENIILINLCHLAAQSLAQLLNNFVLFSIGCFLEERAMITLGVPINHNKTQGPCTKITFFDLGIDTINYTICIPDGKSIQLQEKLNYALNAKKGYFKRNAVSSMPSFCHLNSKPLTNLHQFYTRQLNSPTPHSSPIHSASIS